MGLLKAPLRGKWEGPTLGLRPRGDDRWRPQTSQSCQGMSALQLGGERGEMEGTGEEVRAYGRGRGAKARKQRGERHTGTGAEHRQTGASRELRGPGGGEGGQGGDSGSSWGPVYQPQPTSLEGPGRSLWPAEELQREKAPEQIWA